MGSSQSSGYSSNDYNRALLRQIAIGAILARRHELNPAVLSNFTPMQSKLLSLIDSHSASFPNFCSDDDDSLWTELCYHYEAFAEGGAFANAENICCSSIPSPCRHAHTTCSNLTSCVQPTCGEERNYLSDYEATITAVFSQQNLTIIETHACVFAKGDGCEEGEGGSFPENPQKKAALLGSINYAIEEGKLFSQFEEASLEPSSLEEHSADSPVSIRGKGVVEVAKHAHEHKHSGNVVAYEAASVYDSIVDSSAPTGSVVRGHQNMGNTEGTINILSSRADSPDVASLARKHSISEKASDDEAAEAFDGIANSPTATGGVVHEHKTAIVAADGEVKISSSVADAVEVDARN